MQCVCNAMCIMHLPFIFVGNAQKFNAPDIILECTFVLCMFSFLPECIKHFFLFQPVGHCCYQFYICFISF